MNAGSISAKARCRDQVGGDQTNVGDVGGNVDASHDDNSTHTHQDIHQGVDVDLF